MARRRVQTPMAHCRLESRMKLSVKPRLVCRLSDGVDFRCFEASSIFVPSIAGWRRQMTRTIWLAFLLVLIGIAAPARGQATQPGDSATVVLLVRHAEKAAQPADDPPLTQDGRHRAEALAAVTKDAHPTAIITTQLRRTVETAQPSASTTGITPE